MSDKPVIHSENEYEDLLGQWSDLESGLGVVLGNPSATQQFTHRIVQYDRWMRGLMHRDPDVGLYLLFQLSSNSPVGYSASHALVCATLCHLLAAELNIAPKERDSLVHAALTMNVAMTALQDELASQAEKPTPEQQAAIRGHPIKGGMMLANMGVTDELWLDIVTSHHADSADQDDLHEASPANRLTRIVKVVDRYAAMISPRMSRAGRTATESARAVLANSSAKSDVVGHALVRAVGLCPPGTFVQLDNGDLAVVLRRSSSTNMPYVAVVGRGASDMPVAPRLLRTSDKGPRIKAGLPANAIKARLNHFQILQLGASAG